MELKTIGLLLTVFMISLYSCRNNSKVDRYLLVTGNNIENSSVDSLSSLSVGNGQFAFTVDITGLQTFPELYPGALSLRTIADWGCTDKVNPENNYRFHLGMIGLQIMKENGEDITINDIEDPVQTLNLWTGEIDSRFSIEGVPVRLKTVCHPDYDLISVKVISDLIGKKRLKIKINFPLGVFTPPGYDFNAPGKHTTSVLSDTNNLVVFGRSQHNENYNVVFWCNSAELKKVTQHLYYLAPDRVDSVYSFSCQFLNNQENGRVQNFGETETASKKRWEKFWTTKAAVDLSEYTDPRLREKQRQAILTQYLGRIQKFSHNGK